MDFDTQAIKDLMDIAGGGAKTADALVSTAGRLKGLFKSAEPSADVEVKLALSELTEQVANARFANAQLSFRLESLLRAYQEAEAAQTQLARYRLHRFESGQFAYALREGEADGEPEHFCCPACFVRHARSILQPRTNVPVLDCKECGAAIWMQKPDPEPRGPRAAYSSRSVV